MGELCIFTLNFEVYSYVNLSETEKEETGPSPCTYHIPRKPPHQRNAPMYSMGKRTFNEKPGGARTSWQKEWFNSKNPFTQKTDFNREYTWPAPNNYRLRSTLGVYSQSSVYHHAPSYTIGNKLCSAHTNKTSTKNMSISGESLFKDAPIDDYQRYMHLIEEELSKSNLVKDMSEDEHHRRLLLEYLLKKKAQSEDVMQSVKNVLTSAPKVSIKLRRHGTECWQKAEKTPGPGAYDLNKYKNVKKSMPKFTVPHAKADNRANFAVGPYYVI